MAADFCLSCDQFLFLDEAGECVLCAELSGAVVRVPYLGNVPGITDQVPRVKYCATMRGQRAEFQTLDAAYRWCREVRGETDLD